MTTPTKHLVIADVQVKPGQDFTFLRRIGTYIVEKKPDVVICIGDFADMPSLSSYDVGKKSFEGRRYKDDINAAHAAMEALLGPLWEANAKAKKGHRERYNPKLVLTLGNHEDRITRAIEGDAKLDGTIGLQDLKYAEYGWDVIPYLQPITIDGITYCHYFTSGVMGRPVTSARMLVQKKHQSCIQGHVQHWDIHREVRADGTPVIGMFAGSTYEHDEDYLGPQGNNYDRGIWMLHEVKGDGSFQPMYVSLNYLKKKYERS